MPTNMIHELAIIVLACGAVAVGGVVGAILALKVRRPLVHYVHQAPQNIIGSPSEWESVLFDCFEHVVFELLLTCTRAPVNFVDHRM